MSKQIMKFRL